MQAIRSSSTHLPVSQLNGLISNSAWKFWNTADPTHGLVEYISDQEAKSLGLAYYSSNVAVIKVDNATALGYGVPRKSVRLHSKKKWTTGLFIGDFSFMPCVNFSHQKFYVNLHPDMDVPCGQPFGLMGQGGRRAVR